MVASIIPGANIIGYGYDIFGLYADKRSLKTLLIKEFSNYEQQKVGDTVFNVPMDTSAISLFRSTLDTVSGKTISEYQSALTSKVNSNGHYKLFFASLDASFSKSNQMKEEEDFVTSVNNISAWTISLDTDVKTLLRDDVSKDIDSLAPNTLFSKYGTHVLVKVVMGATARYSYAVNKNAFKSNLSIEETAKASYRHGTYQLTVEEEAQYEKDINSFNSSSELSIDVRGGDPRLGAMIETEGKFQEWAATAFEYAELIDFTTDSLQPIWTLASSQSRATELENAFNTYAEQKSVDQIEIKFTKDFFKLFDNQSLKSDKDLTIYKPVATGDYYFLGHYAQANYSAANGQALIVRDLSGGALAPPTGYEEVWRDKNSNSKNDNYACWRPIPPTGYVSLGWIMTKNPKDQGYPTPSGTFVDRLRCVREDLVTEARIEGSSIWSDAGSDADDDLSLWNISPKDNNAIDSGTFYGWKNKDNQTPSPNNIYAILQNLNKS